MTPATIYRSSRGPVEIKWMPYPHLAAALAKLRREQPDRVPEIEGMAARLAELDAMPDDAARIAATTRVQTEGMVIVAPSIAEIGHNEAPTLDTFEAIDAHIRDLYLEAQNFADGKPLESQAQADEVSRLLRMIEAAEKRADELRKAENEPFDTGKAAVQAKYAPLISNTKAVTGLTVKAQTACRATLRPWLLKLDDERRALEAAQRAEADELLETARVAKAAADPANLAEAERVEEMFGDAKAAEKEAGAIGKDRASAGGGEFRRVIMRDNFVPYLIDGTAALRHYWTTRRPEIEAFALTLAKTDVKNGARTIPGFKIPNEKTPV